MDIIAHKKKRGIARQRSVGENKTKKTPRAPHPVSSNEPFVYQLGYNYRSHEVPFFGTSDYRVSTETQDTQHKSHAVEGLGSHSYILEEGVPAKVLAQDEEVNHHRRETASFHAEKATTSASPQKQVDDVVLRDLFTPLSVTQPLLLPLPFMRRMSYHFGMIALFAFLVTSSLIFVGEVTAVKERVLQSGDAIVASAKRAIIHAQDANLDALHTEIATTHSTFVTAQNDLQTLNSFIIWSSQFIPGASRLASGDALVAIGVALTRATNHLVMHTQTFLPDEDADPTQEPYDFLVLIQQSFLALKDLSHALHETQEHLPLIRDDDLPEEGRQYISQLRHLVPRMTTNLDSILALETVLEDIVGTNGPRTYLFLFQNNQEARATGGFIGSYGLLDMTDGTIREFFIDGIYNPDGQLRDKVVPPLPIQKISAAWSLHDSNWWPDFPRSAEVAVDFYERTGGRSIDGVVMMTPTMMEKILRITGPIYMEDYAVTLTAENFIEMTQYKVEEDYDREENRPKKILSDLMPLVVAKLTDDLSGQKMLHILSMVIEGLDEKHILLYSRNDTLQQYIAAQRWDGRIQETESDYLSVVNTNINGFKTDGVINQHIAHQTEIHPDGRIIDTVTVTREHRGGHTGREWWDAVNANYMRVYVPEGSRLLSVEGHTREINDERLSYDQIGFERYDDVVREEENMHIHKDSGTRVYTESGKTVFANWVYVSPQEQVHVTYRYELPWNMQFDTENAALRAASHGLLLQKQSGTNNVTFESTVLFPNDYAVAWSTDDVADEEGRLGKKDGRLDVDYYRGIIFTTPH